MSAEIVLCIPGPWKDRSELLHRVITLEPNGRFVFLGRRLADRQEKDSVSLELQPADEEMAHAFRLAGQGKLSEDVLARIGDHTAVVYLFFPAGITEQKDRMAKFSGVLERLGGIAVKVESAGVAHGFERWRTLLAGSPFDLYCASVVLVADESQYFSCGMHHYQAPDCEVPSTLPGDEAAELMNQFNLWRIDSRPTLDDGHTFSLAEDAPVFRMELKPDTRHDPDDLFHNPHGVWRLDPV